MNFQSIYTSSEFRTLLVVAVMVEQRLRQLLQRRPILAAGNGIPCVAVGKMHGLERWPRWFAFVLMGQNEESDRVATHIRDFKVPSHRVVCQLRILRGLKG